MIALAAVGIIALCLGFVAGTVWWLEDRERRFQREQLAADFQRYLTEAYLAD